MASRIRRCCSRKMRRQTERVHSGPEDLRGQFDGQWRYEYVLSPVNSEIRGWAQFIEGVLCGTSECQHSGWAAPCLLDRASPRHTP
jgi:hypothetical protein